MGSVTLNGSTSGQITLTPPAVAGTNTITLPAVTDTMVGLAATQTLTNKTLTSPTLTSPTMSGAVVSTMASSVITSGTSVASTSGTSIDFTNIPSWAKRITVILNGVSTSGTSLYLIQLGSTTFTTTGYLCSASQFATAPSISATNSTIGLLFNGATSATALWYGAATILNISSNNWVSFSTLGRSDAAVTSIGGGSIALSGVLDRVRITTVNGTDTFDAGTINILYE